MCFPITFSNYVCLIFCVQVRHDLHNQHHQHDGAGLCLPLSVRLSAEVLGPTYILLKLNILFSALIPSSPWNGGCCSILDTPLWL